MIESKESNHWLMGEIYGTTPSLFIQQNWPKLLPHWSKPPQTLLLVCFRAQENLSFVNETVQREKDRLWQAFHHCAQRLHPIAQSQGILLEAICPKTGLAVQAPPQSGIFDLVYLFHDRLGFPWQRTTQGCKVVTHPRWQQAFYPALWISPQDSDRVTALVYDSLSSPMREPWSKLTITTLN